MSKSKKQAVQAVTEEQTKTKRQYIQAPVAIDPGIPCSHCGHRYGHKVTNTYRNGNRRRVCGGCGLPFVTVQRPPQMAAA